jgi:uncharacterized protein (TIGR00251 family)
MRYSVTIKPNSRKGPLVEAQSDDSLLVFVREPATEGKANSALIALLAVHFKVPKTRIEIVRGHTSRHKVISVDS